MAQDLALHHRQRDVLGIASSPVLQFDGLVHGGLAHKISRGIGDILHHEQWARATDVAAIFVEGDHVALVACGVGAVGGYLYFGSVSVGIESAVALHGCGVELDAGGVGACGVDDGEHEVVGAVVVERRVQGYCQPSVGLHGQVECSVEDNCHLRFQNHVGAAGKGILRCVAHGDSDFAVVVASGLLLEADSVDDAAVAQLLGKEKLLGEAVVVVVVQRQIGQSTGACGTVADDDQRRTIGTFGDEGFGSGPSARGGAVAEGLHTVVVEGLGGEAFQHVTGAFQLVDEGPLVVAVGAVLQAHGDGATGACPADDGSVAAGLGRKVGGIDTQLSAVVLEASDIDLVAIAAGVAGDIGVPQGRNGIATGIDAGGFGQQTVVAVVGGGKERVQQRRVAAIIVRRQVEVTGAHIATLNSAVAHGVNVGLRGCGVGEEAVAPHDGAKDGVIAVVGVLLAQSGDGAAAGDGISHHIAAHEGGAVDGYGGAGGGDVVGHEAAFEPGVAGDDGGHMARVADEAAADDGVAFSIDAGAGVGVAHTAVGCLDGCEAAVLGIDAAALVVGGAATHDGVFHDGAVGGIDATTGLSLAVFDGEVVDAQATAHVDAAAVGISAVEDVALTEGEAVPEGGGVEVAFGLGEHTLCAAAIEDGGVLHEVALGEVEGFRLVADESAIDVDAFADDEAAAIDSLGDPYLHRLAIEGVRCFSGIQRPGEAASSIGPGGAVADALGGDVVAALATGCGGEAHGAPQRGVALATNGAGTHRVARILVQTDQWLLFLQREGEIVEAVVGLVLQFNALGHLAGDDGGGVCHVGDREEGTGAAVVATKDAEEHHVTAGGGAEVSVVVDAKGVVAIGVECAGIVGGFHVVGRCIVIVIGRGAVDHGEHEVAEAVVVVAALQGYGQPSVGPDEVHQCVVDKLLAVEEDHVVAGAVAGAVGGAHIDFEVAGGVETGGELEAQGVDDAGGANFVFHEELLGEGVVGIACVVGCAAACAGMCGGVAYGHHAPSAGAFGDELAGGRIAAERAVDTTAPHAEQVGGLGLEVLEHDAARRDVIQHGPLIVGGGAVFELHRGGILRCSPMDMGGRGGGPDGQRVGGHAEGFTVILVAAHIHLLTIDAVGTREVGGAAGSTVQAGIHASGLAHEAEVASFGRHKGGIAVSPIGTGIGRREGDVAHAFIAALDGAVADGGGGELQVAAVVGAVAPHEAVCQRAAIDSHGADILPDGVHHDVAVHQGVGPSADDDIIVGMVVVNEAVVERRRAVGQDGGGGGVVHDAAAHEGVSVGVDDAVVGGIVIVPLGLMAAVDEIAIDEAVAVGVDGSTDTGSATVDNRVADGGTGRNEVHAGAAAVVGVATIAIHDAAVVDLHLIVHMEAGTLVAAAAPQGEAVEDGYRLAPAVVVRGQPDDAALVTCIENGDVLSEIATGEVEGVGLVTGKAAIDIHRILYVVGICGGGVAIVGAAGDADVRVVAIGQVGGTGCAEGRSEIGESVVPCAAIGGAVGIGLDVDVAVAHRSGGYDEMHPLRGVVLTADITQPQTIGGTVSQAGDMIERGAAVDTGEEGVSGAIVTADGELWSTMQTAQREADGVAAGGHNAHARPRATVEVATTVDINVGSDGGIVGSVEVGGTVAVVIAYGAGTGLAGAEVAVVAALRRGGILHVEDEVARAVVLEGLLEGYAAPVVAAEGVLAVEDLLHRQAVDGGHRGIGQLIEAGSGEAEAEMASHGATAGVAEAEGVDGARLAAQLGGTQQDVAAAVGVAHVDGEVGAGAVVAIPAAHHQRGDGIAATAIEVECIAVVRGGAAAYRAHTYHIIFIFFQPGEGVAAGRGDADGGPQLAVDRAVADLVAVDDGTGPTELYAGGFDNAGRKPRRGETDKVAGILIAAHVGSSAIDADTGGQVGGGQSGKGNGGVDGCRAGVEAVVAIAGVDEVEVVLLGVAAGIEGVHTDIARTADGTIEGAIADAVEGVDQVGGHVVDHTARVVLQGVLGHDAVR